MPSIKNHFDWALQSENFCKSLHEGPLEYRSWMVVAAFYSALHYCSAYLVDRGKSPLSVESSDTKVSEYFPDLAEKYRELKDHSRNWLSSRHTFTAAKLDSIRRDFEDLAAQIKARA